MTRTQGSVRRPYRMDARSAAAAATTDRIIDVARRRFATMAFDQVTLSDIATEAGVGVQTLLRRFASKEDLLIAVVQRRSNAIRTIRDASPLDDPASAIHDLIDTYERFGDEVLALMAQETRNPVVAGIVRAGRDYHHEWVARIWGSFLRSLPRRDQTISNAQLVAATDLYTWKIYRRDIGLSRRAAEGVTVSLCSTIVRGGSRSSRQPGFETTP